MFTVPEHAKIVRKAHIDAILIDPLTIQSINLEATVTRVDHIASE